MKGWYGWAFGLGTALAFMLHASLWPGYSANDILLRVVGLISVMYVRLDIWSDTLARPRLMSDARMLAINYGGTGEFWGVVWMLVSVLVIGPALWRAYRRVERNRYG